MPAREAELLGKRERRSFGVERKAVNGDARTVDVAFSSEAPVERAFGWEVLDHSPDGADLSRLNNGAPVLVNHNPNDQVGVVESARIDEDGVGRATLRFSKTSRANDVFGDIEDGIRQKLSVGYEYIGRERGDDADDGMPSYRFRWAPYELSIVSIPADDSVGVGRSDDESGGAGTPSEPDPVPQPKRNKTMSKDNDNGAGVATPPEPSAEQIRAIEEKAVKDQLDRINNIRSFARRASIAESEVEKAIKDGVAFETFTRNYAEGGIATVTPSAAQPDLEIGLNAKERGMFSVVKAMRELSDPRQGLSGLEKEVSEATRKQLKLEDGDGDRIHIPLDIMVSEVNGRRRDLEAGTAAEGGHSVQTDLGGMIELLRNQTKVLELGATQLTGLRGNLALPRQDGAATASWVDEEGTVSDTAQTFGQLSLTPNRLAARTAYSDQLLTQSSVSIEQFVRNDLMRVTAIELDRAALHGSGASNQPLGLDGTSGIGSVTFGGSPTWADVIEFETDVSAANGLTGNAAFLTSSAVRGAWKSTVRVASTDSIFLIEDNEANGYPVHVSENVTGNVVFFGVWSQLLVATWGAMSVIVDPYSKAATGQRVITVCSFHDVGVRQPSSFSVSTDAGNQ